MISFDTGLAALRAAQLAMQVVGQNVANADTEGYSRQRAVLGAVAPAPTGTDIQVGQGVDVTAVRREADDLLAGRLRTESSLQGRLDALASRYSEIEAVLGEPGDGSLGAAMSDFFDRMSELAANPSDPTLRGQAVLAAEGLAQSFGSMAARLESIQRDIRPEVLSHVDAINEAAVGVAALNKQIVEANQRGNPANELLDQRERLLREMSRRVDISVIDDPNGSATVLVSGRLLVSGDRAGSLEVASEDDGAVRLRLVGTEGAFEPSGGTIQGLVEIESRVVPEILDRLDTLARNLAREVNAVHSRGVGLEGSFRSLVAGHVADLDRPLAEAGLPFTPEAGPLYVSVTRTTTGEVEQYRIDFDPTRQGIRDLVDEINGLGGVQASVDPSGRMTVRGLPGFTFDFSDRVDPDPGALGGAEVGLSGRFAGPGNESITLKAIGTGRVGVAAGLQVEVLDGNGNVLRTLDVGLGYSPGSAIELAPGVTVRFGSGDLTAGDELSVELISEPDQGGVLAALGLNALFVGGGARDLRVADGLAQNPSNLALGLGGRGGDNGVALDVLALRDVSLPTLGGSTTEYYGLMVGDIGQQRRSTETLRQNEKGLVRALETRRQEISGVNIDEEMVDLIRYQRGFEAAARFLTTISEITELLVSLG